MMTAPRHAHPGPVRRRLLDLFDELFVHDGYGELRVELRILKRGQKEIIVHCGKQYRYVVDFRAMSRPQGSRDESSPYATHQQPAEDEAAENSRSDPT